MKLLHLFAIASVAVTGLMGATAAQAQDWGYRDHHERRWERHERAERWARHHRWERERERHHGWDRGHGYGYRDRPACWEEWRHGRPVQVCRR